MLFDCHCHLDQYPNANIAARSAEEAGVFTVAVTNLPSHFEVSRNHVSKFKNVRLALGLHPLLAGQYAHELALFRELSSVTSYVGEVGLDGSREGDRSLAVQKRVFGQILETLAQVPKFMTVHSRGAEREVIHMLRAAGRTGAVFHWFTGEASLIEKIIDDGHLFSVNPAMIRSEKGRRIVTMLPPGRVLTETDGPHVRVAGRVVSPKDIASVIEYLSETWRVDVVDVVGKISENFRNAIAPLRKSQ